METYEVSWEITAEAETPLEAAFDVAKNYFQDRIAQGQPGSACAFHVVDADGNKTTVVLDNAILELDPVQLRQVFETEHPAHDMDQWRNDVAFQDTILGYWEWVQHKLEQASHEA